VITDNPLKTILDRQESANRVRENFSETIGLLRDIIDYGTNLIARCYYTSGKKGLTEVIILGSLLKNAVAMIDAVEILVSAGAVFSANLQARGLFETYLFIKWILKEDTERRVKQYYVWQKREELIVNKRSLIGSKEHTDYVNLLGEFGKEYIEEVKQKQADIRKVVDSIEELLNRDTYRETNLNFENNKSKKKVEWFRPGGPRNRYEMAIDVGLQAEYLIFYSYYSDVVHVTATHEHIEFKDGYMILTPIRHLEGIRALLNTALVYVLNIYEIVLGHYRPEEVQNFKKKYVSEWRRKFLSIKNVKYNISLAMLD
jgi:hypothetical protein